MTRRRIAFKDHPGGFTLLEVMASMVVFLIGVVGILALFATGLAVHRDASQRTMVSIASDEVRSLVMEQLIGLTGEGVVLPTLNAVPLPGYPGYFYDAGLVPDQQDGVDGGILADVYVYTRDAGQVRGERFKLFVRPNAGPERLIRATRAADKPK